MIDERLGEGDRVDAYLDGELSREEAAEFERDLAGRPEVAAALGAAIVLRDLLGQLPPLRPPPGLEQRIVDALRLGRLAGREEARPVERAARQSAVSSFRAAVRGASWFLRPSAAVMQGGMGGARPLAAGLTQVRWVLGPLAASHPVAEPAPRKGLLRRAFGGLGRLGGLG